LIKKAYKSISFNFEAAFKSSKEINIEFNAFDFDERIDQKLEKALFRISQEALNNIIKHSKAKNAIFQLFKADDLITLTIEDDGIGFDPENLNEQNKGIGLLSIKERVYSFNGTLTMNSRINEGTELIIEIPQSNILKNG